MKKYVLLLLFLLLFTGYISAQQNFAPDMSIFEIRKNSVFPEQKKEGQELYGFTYMVNPLVSEDYKYVVSRWSKIIDSGTVSQNIKGAVVANPYNIILVPNSLETKYFLNLYSRPGPAGYIERTKKYLDEIIAQRKDAITSTTEENGIGDYCLLLELKNCRFEILTLRGPFIFDVSSLPHFKTTAWSADTEISDTFQLTDIASTVADPGAINAKLPDWNNAQKEAMRQLMKDFLADFNLWYNAPVAGLRGDGFKGYFWPDPQPFYPAAGDLPQGVTIEKMPDFTAANIIGSAAYLFPKRKGERYTLSFDIRPPYSTDDKIDSSLEFVKSAFKEAVGAMKRAKSIPLPGADEAYRTVWRHQGNNDKIMFRRDNIIVTVTGFNQEKKEGPVIYTPDIAKIVALKIDALGKK